MYRGYHLDFGTYGCYQFGGRYQYRGQSFYLANRLQICDDLLLGRMAPRENPLLCNLALHIWNYARDIRGLKLLVEWIPAHMGIEGNELADKLAKMGKQLPAENYGHRLRDWDETCFRDSLRSLHVPFTHVPSIGKGCVRINAGDQRRSDIREGPHLVYQKKRSGINLGTFTSIIVDAGDQFGQPIFPGRFTIQKDDLYVCLLKSVEARRKTCRDPVKRQSLSLATWRARRMVQRMRAELEATYCAKFGGAPYRSKRGPHVYSLQDEQDLNIVYDDGEDIVNHVEKFYLELYNGPNRNIADWIWNEFDQNEFGRYPLLGRSQVVVFYSKLKGIA